MAGLEPLQHQGIVRCDTGRMAEKKVPKGVVSEEITWHLPDGTPTSDKEAAVSAEITTTYADGSVTRRLMRQAGTALM